MKFSFFKEPFLLLLLSYCQYICIIECAPNIQKCLNCYYSVERLRSHFKSVISNPEDIGTRLLPLCKTNYTETVADKICHALRETIGSLLATLVLDTLDDDDLCKVEGVCSRRRRYDGNLNADYIENLMLNNKYLILIQKRADNDSLMRECEKKRGDLLNSFDTIKVRFFNGGICNFLEECPTPQCCKDFCTDCLELAKRMGEEIFNRFTRKIKKPQFCKTLLDFNSHDNKPKNSHVERVSNTCYLWIILGILIIDRTLED